MDSEDKNELFTINAAARYLRVPLKWLVAEAEAGRVPALRAGNRFLMDVNAVEAVLLERARQSPAAAKTVIESAVRPPKGDRAVSKAPG